MCRKVHVFISVTLKRDANEYIYIIAPNLDLNKPRI